MKFLTSLMELTTSSFVRSLFETEEDEESILSGSIYFLGKSYLLPSQKTQFERDVITRFWFTYRQGFAPIGDAGPTSDQGWGCMLRCGQMLMAHALVCRHLGRTWLWDYSLNPNSISSTQALTNLHTYHSILRSFHDKRDSCYSVHQLTSIGASDGKRVGEWYGPNTIAHVLKRASGKDGWSGVVVHVCMDNTLIISHILDRCKGKGESSGSLNEGHDNNSSNNSSNSSGTQLPWKPLLLIIPLRLGVTGMNKAYHKPLKTFFELRQSAGVLGGRPNNAYWFVGYSDDFLLYFDPHTVQPISDERCNIHSSYHITCPSRVHVSQLDPSIAVAFFCSSESDFNDLICNLRDRILCDSSSAVFEVHASPPTTRPPFSSSSSSSSSFVNNTTHTASSASSSGGGCARKEQHCLQNEAGFEVLNYDEEFEIIE